MNLKELAAELNLSSSTISRVLNDKPGISEKTRKLVLEAVERTGFSQNFSAQNLANPKARFIGVIGRKRGEQQDQLYFHHSMELFEEYFQAHNYQCINLGIVDDSVLELKEILSGSPLGENDFAGLIIRGQSFPVKTILSLKARGIPIVLLENKLQQTKIDSVVCEDKETIYKLTNEMISRKYKKIIHITGPEEWYNNRERIRGYREAMKEAGMDDKVISLSDTTVDTGIEAFELIKEDLQAHTGIIAANDAMAIGFTKACREKGISIPDELAITGFDDIPWAQHSYPPLTTAKVYIEEMSKLAASRLLQLMETPDSRPVTIRVPADIILRDTI
ncbi:MAG: LacI family DNA-binding transcriptional regulator [Spirochaetales bacterium]|nr:LacI family DNA-binding transcriptional regulator [Spirochaetales bacterium]